MSGRGSGPRDLGKHFGKRLIERLNAVDQSDFLRDVLESEGFAVDTAFSGDIALRWLSERNYDGAIMDVLKGAAAADTGPEIIQHMAVEPDALASRSEKGHVSNVGSSRPVGKRTGCRARFWGRWIGERIGVVTEKAAAPPINVVLNWAAGVKK